jgi:hypothetical protein
MGLFSNIVGTTSNLFQLGLGGPQIRNNAGVIEARNPANSAFVIARGLDPVAANDLMNLGSHQATHNDRNIYQSQLSPGNAGFLLLTGVAYFVFLCRTPATFTPKFVEFQVSTIGAGTQTAEVGLFSTTAAPNKANQVLTKIESTGTMSVLTSTGVKRNTSAFATSVPAGTYLWAGIRTAMATTQPTIWGLGVDMAQGQILSTAAAALLTAAGPWTGAIIAAATGVSCPDLRMSLI